MFLSVRSEREETYETKEKSKTEKRIRREGNGMLLTKSDLQAIQILLQPLNNRLDKVDERLDGIDNRLDRMDERFDRMDERLDGMESRMDRLENKVDKVESEVSALKSGQLEIRKDLKVLDKKITDTYDLALDAWGQSTENRTWLESGSDLPFGGFRTEAHS